MVPASLTTGETPQTYPAVLIVEDDVLIRAAAAQYLRGTGFEVLEAVDVDEAVAILRATKGIRVVFTDVKLAGDRTGFDLLEIIRQEFPEVKVLFTSGIVKGDEVARTGVPFIRKPYFLFEIERQIKTLVASD
jgi:CheY-like chemotaxis protein